MDLPKNTFFPSSRNYYRFQLIQQLDHWGFRILSIGFLFLTIGILSGAVWEVTWTKRKEVT